MTTSGASAVASSSTPSSITPATPITSFTPLESFFLFQAIIQHGVEPESFVRIATILKNNAFVRCDESYNADRLTPESLQRLFLHLLDEVADEDTSRKDDSGGDLSKKRKTPGAGAPPTLNDARVKPERLQVLVERLYARYRKHIVDSIRDDERRIEKVQHEIRVLEQQVVGGGGRGAHARAAAAAAAAEERKSQAAAARASETNAAATLNGRQQQPAQAPARQAAASPQSRFSEAAANGSHSLPASLPSSVPPSSQAAIPTSTVSEGQTPAGQRLPSGVPLLPATFRGAQPLSPGSTPAPPRTTASPTLQHQPLQQQAGPSSHTPSELAPHHPASSSQPPSRASTVAPTASREPLAAPGGGKLLAAAPAGQSGASSQPASRSLSPVRSTHQPSQQQTLLPATVKPYSAPLAAAPGQTPRTQMSGPALPSTAQPTTPLEGQQASAHPSAQVTQTAPAAGPRTETPRPLVPATQKHTPIAPVPQAPVPFQRPPGGASTPGAAGPQAVAGTGISTRPLLPDHVRGGPPSRTPTPVQSPRPALPQTPIHGMAATATASFLPRGSGTRWKPSEPTPSTPGPDVGHMASPAYEPLSPVQMTAASRDGSADVTDADASSVSPSASATMLRQPRNLRKPHPMPTKLGQKGDTAASSRTARAVRPARHTRSQAGDNTDDDGGLAIKAEESTPRAFDDGTEDMDDNADSPGGALASSRSFLKRKRRDDDSVDLGSSAVKNSGSSNRPDLSVLARRRLVGPPTPPTHVLWMRGFPKISASALDQISSHRHANMFAHKIRDRDAPGYSSIVRHPVDLKSIRMAITHGNKAATAMAATLSESDPQLALSFSGSSSMWLPISEDLVPPRGIINSSQLECELVHMFANAVMYNPDSHRGPGPVFLVGDAADDDELGGSAAGGSGGGGAGGGDNARYKVDEDGVVNDTRDMYVEVEKLLSEMRSAERQRGMPPPPSGAKGLDLPLDDGELNAVAAAVAAGEPSSGGGGGDGFNDEAKLDAKRGKDGKGNNDEGGDDDDAEATGSAAGAEGTATIKRRRITRGQ